MKKLLFIGVASLSVAAANATIVYDNITGATFGFYFPNNGLAVADDATLAGTDRLVTSVDVGLYNALATYTGTLTVTLYNVTGSGATWELGSMLASGSTPLAYTSAAFQTETVNFASVLVPNEIAIGFEFSGATAGDIGVLVGNNPSVGSSAERIGWFTTMWNYGSFGGNPAANLAMTVNAVVPEPATLLVVGAGLAALAARRRRK